MIARIVPRFALLSALAIAPSLAAQRAAPGDLDGYLRRALATWEVPGLAVAVVKDDSVVYARGFGVKRLGEPAPITERTLFAIGSCTKAFTAAALAMLVDSGLVAWDDPVTRYLPELELHDPYVTRELTIRDLLSHRSGLSRADGLWWATPYTRREILRRIRYLEPSWSFRSRYAYQNIMFLAAGEIVPAATGTSWDEFVRRRIFEPLGMATSNTSVAALDGGADVATPHQRIDGRMQPIPYRNLDNVGPAGSINSSVLEMAQWIRLQLHQGVFRERRLLAAERIKEMWSPQTIIPLDSVTERLRPSTHFQAYGLGWSLSDYRGRKLVSHSGAIDGMRAIVALVPEERLGVVALANGGEPGRLLTQAVAFRVIDAYLGGPPNDWSAELRAVYGAQLARESAERARREADRVRGTTPSLPLPRYTGTYRSELYGDVAVSVENDRLVMRFGAAHVGDLEHWHYDTFQARWRSRVMGTDLITFALGSDGRAERLTWEGFGDFTAVGPSERTRGP